MRKTLRSQEQSLLLNVPRAARKNAGLTQQALATKLRRPQSFVAKCENGERRIDVIELIEFARILDVPPTTLLRRLVEAMAASVKPRAALSSSAGKPRGGRAGLRAQR